MKLEKFSKNKKQKKIIIVTIVGLILLVGGITLYRTFAFYEEKKEFNVLRGKVPAFGDYDIEMISIYLNDEEIKNIPSKGNYIVSIDCKNGTGYWDYNSWSVSIKDFQKGTKCNVYFEEGIPYMSDYLIAQSKVDASIQKVIHEETVQTGTNATIDYRYTGKDVNNYICFKDGECSENELYRIIGVIPTQSSNDGIYENRVKVIKATNYEGSEYILANEAGKIFTKSGKGYRWDNWTNLWYQSTLYYALSGEYYNSLGTIKNYIERTKWYLGAPIFTDAYSPEQFYIDERSKQVAKNEGNSIINHISFVGLMYPSDYGFSATSDKIEDLYHKPINANYTEFQNSWLYNGGNIHEWTMSPENSYISGTAGYAFYINPSGTISINAVNGHYIFEIRPVFNLKSDVQYESGIGTKDSPYYISLN